MTASVSVCRPVIVYVSTKRCHSNRSLASVLPVVKRIGKSPGKTSQVKEKNMDKSSNDEIAQTQYNYDHSGNAEVLSFDHWDDARSDNIDRVLEENRRLKPARLELFKLIIDFLDQINVPYFISDGTALAVYRDNGVMIPHDYDTDVGIMEEHFMTIEHNLHLLPEHIKSRSFCNHTNSCWIDRHGKEIPFNGYGVKSFVFRDVRDYSHLKLEYSYKFKVSMDVITWKPSDANPDILTVNYASPLLDWSDFCFPKEFMFPTREYVFEGMTVKGPNDLQKYLEINYGYLGKDARWEPKLKRYVPRSTPLSTNLKEYHEEVTHLGKILLNDSEEESGLDQILLDDSD